MMSDRRAWTGPCRTGRDPCSHRTSDMSSLASLGATISLAATKVQGVEQHLQATGDRGRQLALPLTLRASLLCRAWTIGYGYEEFGDVRVQGSAVEQPGDRLASERLAEKVEKTRVPLQPRIAHH